MLSLLDGARRHARRSMAVHTPRVACQSPRWRPVAKISKSIYTDTVDWSPSGHVTAAAATRAVSRSVRRALSRSGPERSP
jgi:hypothetical protein